LTMDDGTGAEAIRESDGIDHAAWHLRPFLLLVLGALCGLAFHGLISDGESWRFTHSAARWGGAGFVAVGGIVLAFSLERLRWLWAVVFALAAGAVVGLVTYNNGGGDWGGGEGWQFFSALLAVAIAVPLFQAARDAGGPRLVYRQVHAHCWTNLVLGFAAVVFVGIVFILCWLLSALFELIGLHLLRDLMQKAWFGWMLSGAALGAAIGLLRDRDSVLRILQKVVMAVLSVLAPVLAVGLVFFVLALPFTGLKPLWEQTKSTTPILLACVFGAVILCNAVIGNRAQDEARSPLLRYPAMALAAVMLPLAIVAAASTGGRIRQYGFTPDRLWAAVFVAFALVTALAYVAALLLGKARWPDRVRHYNIRIALGICAVALILALPVISFGAISAHDQMARLQSGRVSPDKFDWTAMRFDFGPAGVDALKTLRASRNPLVTDLAGRALAQTDRYSGYRMVEQAMSPKTIIVRPNAAEVPQALRDALLPGSRSDDAICTGEGDCLLFWKPGEATAIALLDPCPGQNRQGATCELNPHVLTLQAGKWQAPTRGGGSVTLAWNAAPAIKQALAKAQNEAIARGDIQVREVVQHQLFIGGKPEGEPFN
jgi:hypothetical protein